MSDTAGYADPAEAVQPQPVQPAPMYPYPAQPPVVRPQHTEAEAAELEALYAKLKPEAIAEARKYVLNRTPAQFQLDMEDLIATDFPPPEPPPVA